MANKKQNNNNAVRFIVGTVIIVGLLYVFTKPAFKSPESMRENAMSDTVLTVGDDTLSLQQDLNSLQNDDTLAEEAQLETLE